MLGADVFGGEFSPREKELSILRQKLADVEEKLRRANANIKIQAARCTESPTCDRCNADYDISESIAPFQEDLKKLRVSKMAARAASGPTVHFPFETPYVRAHMQNFYGSQAAQQMNAHLYNLIIHQYDKLHEKNSALQHLRPKDINDLFFNWQKISKSPTEAN